jgi:hypothetical protein
MMDHRFLISYFLKVAGYTMLQNNISITEALLSSNGSAGELLSFCLSDKAALPIQKIFHGELSPIDYTVSLIKLQGKYIKDTFFKPRLGDKKVSDAWLKVWMFDGILRQALYTRFAVLNPNSLASVNDWMGRSEIFSLAISIRDQTTMSRSGLCDFSKIASAVHRDPDVIYPRQMSRLLYTLAKQVSSIDQDDWIFHDPQWASVFSDNLRRYTDLRNLLHTAFMIPLVDPDTADETFGMDHKATYRLVEDLIALRLSSSTTKQEIASFISEVSVKVGDLARSAFHHYLYGGNFTAFNYMYEMARPTFVDRNVKWMSPNAPFSSPIKG